jgi:uncharacterized membrane protein YkvA (DUF1232 family)
MPVWAWSLVVAAAVYAAGVLALVAAGQLDDAVLVALVLRIVLRGSGEALLREHWPGPDRSLRAVSRLAFG